MIIKTKWSNKGSNYALNLIKYIENDVHKNKIYNSLYYESAPPNAQDIKEFLEFTKVGNFQEIRLRHIIIAPENWMDEYRFYIAILKTMESWISTTNRWSIRYLWGLHYNTDHPHAHLVLTAAFPEDLMMDRRDLKEFAKSVEKVFGEKTINKNKKIEREVERECYDVEMEI